MRNAAPMPRAPVRAFQPAIAADRSASVVCSLTTAPMPTSMDAPAMPPQDGRHEQDGDIRGEGVADEREDAQGPADAHPDERAEAVG